MYRYFVIFGSGRTVSVVLVRHTGQVYRERWRTLTKMTWRTEGGLRASSPGMMGDPGILRFELRLKRKKKKVSSLKSYTYTNIYTYIKYNTSV